MRRTILSLSLVFLALLFISPNVHAFGLELTVYDAKVQASRSYAPDYTKGDFYSTIGAPGLFGMHGIDFTVAPGGSFTINLLTNFDPADPDAHQAEIGDLFLIVNNNFYAFDLSSWASGETYFYSDIDTQTSNEVYRDGNNNGYVFGVDYRIVGATTTFDDQYDSGAIVRRDGGTEVFAASVSRTGPSASQPFYTYSINSGEYLFGDFLSELSLEKGDTVDFVWAHTCGNAVMMAQGTVVTPEPGTIALLGLGLIGLFFGRKRFFKK